MFLLLLTLVGAAPALEAQSKGKTALLHTVGAQGGALMYNTYCFIGALHDGYLNDAWEKDFVSSLLIEQSALMENVSTEYDSLLATGYLDTEDSAYVSQMNVCMGLLQAEAETLKDYINDETEANNDRYMTARDAAWDKIAELLNLNDDNAAVTMKNPFTGTK